MTDYPTREGQKVPNVTFKFFEGGAFKDVTTDDLFKGKTVVVFSLPGAFTPTCSTSHLPRYEELAPVFYKNGVDDILCLSVNDAFVMNSWKADHDIHNVKLVPDGNGEFTEGMGLLVDKSAIGFGKRSWRYSMLVKDGVVTKQFNEKNEDGDPYGVSDADTMIKFINPKAPLPDHVAMLTKAGCPFCAEAKKMLSDKGLRFEEIVLPNATRGYVVSAMTGARTVPQVFVNGKLIGGTDDVRQYVALLRVLSKAP